MNPPIETTATGIAGSKKYFPLLLGWLRSPLFWVLQLNVQLALLLRHDWQGMVITLVAWTLILAVGVYFQFDSLPQRYWLEGDCLKAEDMSGEVLTMQRWVTISPYGILTVYGQTPTRGVSLPVCAYPELNCCKSS